MPRLLMMSALILIFGGCSKDSHEQVARDYLEVMDQFVSTCESISDPEAAKQSKEKISRLLDDLKSLKSRSKELGVVDEEDQKNIEKRYEKEFDSLSEKYTEVVSRIEQNPEVVEVLETELKTLANLVNARPIRLRR